MKKVVCMIALAAISFGTVFANGIPTKSAIQMDTMKMKKKMPMKKKKMKKDTMSKM